MKQWTVAQLLYAKDAVLLAESVEELYRMVSCFDDVCRRRMLKEDASKTNTSF